MTEIKQKCKCLICEKEFTNNNSYIGSHTKRIHKISLYDYILMYYKNLTPNIHNEKCGFCENDAQKNYIIDNINYTYSINYNNGFSCKTKDCINNISIDLLGHEYNKKTYEYIGAKSEYISKLYKISIDESKKMKDVQNKEILPEHLSNINGFILRYGKEEGTIKYYQSSEKRKKSQSLEFNINTYGETKGIEKWNNRIKHLRNIINVGCISKSSFIVDKLLDELKIKFIKEYSFKPNNNKYNKQIDFYLCDYNILIEFFGDYWHMNPKKYKSDFYNKTTKMTAYDIWENDKKRNEQIMSHFNKHSLIIIWESSKITKKYLMEIIIGLNDKNTILYI